MPKGIGCRVAQLATEMNETDRAALMKLLDAPVSSERIAIMLSEHGWRISYQTVRRHILNICSCGMRDGVQ